LNHEPVALLLFELLKLAGQFVKLFDDFRIVGFDIFAGKFVLRFSISSRVILPTVLNDKLLQLCKFLNEKRDMDTSSRLIRLVDDLTHILIEAGKNKLH
jgi:hypothetical protein